MGPSIAVIDTLRGAAEWLELALSLFGAIAILVGAVASLGQLASAPRPGRGGSAAARLTLARHLALALEFQLAADVIETSIAPDWTKLGRLAAIAAIRTALNYFLGRDMDDDRRLLRQHGAEEQPFTPAATSPADRARRHTSPTR
jgi:uncharacterized membrane protein